MSLHVLIYPSQLTTHNSQHLIFSLLIILYCLFIVPECSTTLFVHMSMSSALVLLCWMPAACLFVCLLVATGDIGLSPHIRVRPVMSHFLYHLVCGECCCSNLCLLAADTWSLSLICSSVADPTCVPCDPNCFLRLLVHSQLATNSGCL